MSKSHHGYAQSSTRDAVSLVFSFFLSVVMFVAAALVVVWGFALSEWGLLRAMDESFYNQVLEHVNREATYYTLPTGIDPSVLNGAFEVAEVRSVIDGYVGATFDGEAYDPDVTAARERLTQRVMAAFATDGVETQAEGTEFEASELTETYADAIMDLYKSSLRIPGLDAVVQMRGLVAAYMPVVLIALLILGGMLTYLITRLHHHVHRSVRYLAYAAGGATLMMFVGPLMLIATGSYTGLNVEPQYFYSLCISLISHGLNMCMIASGMMLTLTLALVLASSRLRESAMHRKLRRRQ